LVSKRNYSINDLLRFTNSKSGNILASHRDICSIISIATGSSWTTSATVGIALIGVGGALGFDLGMVAGVISGAYFGDYHQCQTHNLAPAMAGTDLFTTSDI
jgi:Na+/H+ antiporter NhaC